MRRSGNRGPLPVARAPRVHRRVHGAVVSMRSGGGALGVAAFTLVTDASATLHAPHAATSTSASIFGPTLARNIARS